MSTTIDKAAFNRHHGRVPTKFFPITPSDTDDLAEGAQYIAFKTAGAIEVIGVDDSSSQVIPSGVLAVGVWHPMGIKRIKAAGTTAGDIWGAL